jgi:tRNA (cmo5U34)-methyltransferase
MNNGVSGKIRRMHGQGVPVRIQKLFDDCAASYDLDRRRLIPCFDDFYAIAVDILPFHRDRELRVLDLGAGTGLLSARVAARYPRARLMLVDVAPAMLRVAEQRFTGRDADRVTIQLLDYARQPLRGTYDLVVSALSIHHLTDQGKESLFAKIYGILEPGGLFVNADQVLGENAVAEEVYKNSWLRQVRASGIPEEALDAALGRMQEDKMSKLSHQISWLDQAGFDDLTVWYKYYNFVVYSGTRPLAGTGRVRR